jgi:Sel1 repeat
MTKLRLTNPTTKATVSLDDRAGILTALWGARFWPVALLCMRQYLLGGIGIVCFAVFWLGVLSANDAIAGVAALFYVVNGLYFGFNMPKMRMKHFLSNGWRFEDPNNDVTKRVVQKWKLSAVVLLAAILGLPTATALATTADYSDTTIAHVNSLRTQAEAGDPQSQVDFGFCYQVGMVVPKDKATAVSWYRKAADQGFPNGQLKMGMIYRDGEGVPEDDAQAVNWFRKAAEQGNADAQDDLGLMYWAGKGVPQDKCKLQVGLTKLFHKVIPMQRTTLMQ